MVDLKDKFSKEELENYRLWRESLTKIKEEIGNVTVPVRDVDSVSYITHKHVIDYLPTQEVVFEKMSELFKNSDISGRWFMCVFDEEDNNKPLPQRDIEYILFTIFEKEKKRALIYDVVTMKKGDISELKELIFDNFKERYSLSFTDKITVVDVIGDNEFDINLEFADGKKEIYGEALFVSFIPLDDEIY